MNKMEPPSLAGFKRTMKAGKGVRAACWKGTKKRPSKKRVFVEAGVNERGYCVLRCFKNKEDVAHVGEFVIHGPRIEMKQIAEVKDKLFTNGFTVKGLDLVEKDGSKETNPHLYIYTTTNREYSILVNVLQALMASAGVQGICQYANECANTFFNEEGFEDDDKSSVGGSTTAAGSGLEHLRSSSNRSMTSTGSAAKKRFRGLRSAFSSLRKPSQSGTQFTNHGQSMGAIPAHTASEGSLQNTVRGKVNPGKFTSREIAQFVTVIQCCRFLLDFTFLKDLVLFRSLNADATEQSLKLERRLAVERCSLETCSADVVADVLMAVLLKMDQPLIPDQVYNRYKAAIDRVNSFGIAVSKSPSATTAASNLVTSLPYEKAYVLRELIWVINAASGRRFDLELAARLFGPLFVEELRRFSKPTDEFPRGILEAKVVETFQVLLETLAEDVSGIFEEYLGKPEAVQVVKKLTSQLPAQEQNVGIQSITNKKNSIEEDESLEMEDLPILLSNNVDEDKVEVLLPPSKLSPKTNYTNKEEPSSQHRGEEYYRSLAAAVNMDPEVVTSTKQAQQQSQPEAAEKKSKNIHGLTVAVGATTAATVAVASAAAKFVPSPMAKSTASQHYQGNGTSEAPQADAGVSKAAAIGSGAVAALHLEEEKRKDKENIVLNHNQEKHFADIVVSPIEGKDTKEGRIQTLHRLIEWYKSRLSAAPNSRNASLWKREISEFKIELQELEGNESAAEGHEPTGNDVEPVLFSQITKLWQKSQDSSADTLMKRSHPPRKSGRFSRVQSFDSSSKIDRDPYFENPLIALEDSDGLLQKILMELNQVNKDYANDLGPKENNGQRNSNDDDEEQDDDGHVNGTTPRKVNANGALIGLLRENIQLRLELNEIQRGLIQRTQEKAVDFEKAFAEQREKQKRMEQQRLTQQQQQVFKQQQNQPTTTWGAFSSLF